jgi:hypothetical protein
VGGKGIDLEDGGLEGLGAENAVKHGGVHLQGNGDSFQHCERARSMWPIDGLSYLLASRLEYSI